MSNKDEARKAVNNAISSAGSASIGMMVDAALSSKEKRASNRKLLEAEAKKRENIEKAGGSAVRERINYLILNNFDNLWAKKSRLGRR